MVSEVRIELFGGMFFRGASRGSISNHLTIDEPEMVSQRRRRCLMIDLGRKHLLRDERELLIQMEVLFCSTPLKYIKSVFMRKVKSVFMRNVTLGRLGYSWTCCQQCVYSAVDRTPKHT